MMKEGLRLSFALPTRLPRVVPKQGFAYPPCHLPPGTVVGVPNYELHTNPQTFPDPQNFRPQHWVDKSEDSTAMLRDWARFSKGSRACLAKNLATAKLEIAIAEVVRSGCLKGAIVPKDINLVGWFNSAMKGGSVEIAWS